MLPADAGVPAVHQAAARAAAASAPSPVRIARELDFFLDYVPTRSSRTYLDGPEFTIDVLCDFAGTPLSIVPRERVVIRAGVIDRGRTVNDPVADRARAGRAPRRLPFVGAVNIQCRLVDGRPVVFEINPRFSGGIPLTIAAGADFPRMLVELALGRRVPPRDRPVPRRAVDDQLRGVGLPRRQRASDSAATGPAGQVEDVA